MNPIMDQIIARTTLGLGERRHDERVPASNAIRLRTFDRPQWSHGQCTDISRGGLRIYAPAALAVGEVVEIEFVEADGAVTVHARVAYRQGHQYGVSFLDTSSSNDSATSGY